jgi:hypothetical protein
MESAIAPPVLLMAKPSPFYALQSHNFDRNRINATTRFRY